MSCDRWLDELQAYSDDSCAPDAAAGLEAHLRGCAACASSALAQERMKRSIRSAAQRFEPSAEFQQRIESMVRDGAAADSAANAAVRRKQTDRAASSHHFWRQAWVPSLAGAAFVLVLAALTFGIWTRHTARTQAVAELLDLHVATMASLNPVDVVSTDRHTVKPWFEGKLPFTFNLPELQNSSYRLIGGKLVYFEGNPAAQLVFGLGKHELSVFILQNRQSDGATRVLSSPAGEESSRKNGFNLEQWSESGIGFIVMSDASPADVHALSELLRAANRE
jgi:anti-sigma factor RsiW